MFCIKPTYFYLWKHWSREILSCILFLMSHNGNYAFHHSGLAFILLYICVSVCRRRRSGQNDGAEDEGRGGEEEDKRNRGEDVFGRNQRAGLRSCSTWPVMHSALLCLQSYDSKLCAETQVMKMGEKLQGLQEEKHQLFLQLKKVLHEEEKRRRKEQRCVGGRFLSFFLFPFLPGFPSFLSFNLPNRCDNQPHICACSLIIVTSQLWHQPVTSPACLCMLASISSVFQVRPFIHVSSQSVKRCEAKQRPPPGSPVSHSRPGALLGERSKQLFPAAVLPVSKGASYMTPHHFLPATA